MHLTLKKESTKPPSYNVLQQQGRFDDFIEVYNNERPHQALGGKYPGEVYTPTAREYHHPEVPEYPFFDEAENRVEPVGQNPFAPKVLPM